MDNNNTKPDVKKIISMLRQGMEDITPLHNSHPEMGNQHKLNASLRNATETSEVLGRCGGSMRGKLCKLLARIGLPVVEQINMHNTAIIKSLNLINNAQQETLETRIVKLESEIENLKTKINS